MKTIDIDKWQRGLKDAPAVWCTVTEEGELAHVYESLEAAQIETMWCAQFASSHARTKIQRVPIHSLELTMLRFGDPYEAIETGGEWVPYEDDESEYEMEERLRDEALAEAVELVGKDRA